MILPADFEAAFESVAWNYMKSVINKINFGPNLKRILIIYTLTRKPFKNPIKQPLVKENTSTKGVRTGDPACGYLLNEPNWCQNRS